MYSFLNRHFSPPIANLLAILWYAILIAGIVICYHRNTGGFLYLHL